MFVDSVDVVDYDLEQVDTSLEYGTVRWTIKTLLCFLRVMPPA